MQVLFEKKYIPVGEMNITNEIEQSLRASPVLCPQTIRIKSIKLPLSRAYVFLSQGEKEAVLLFSAEENA